MTHPSSQQPSAAEREIVRLRGDLLTISKRFSHDLRTPLGGIISTSEAVMEVLAVHDPAAVSLAGSLLASADEIAQLIKHVSFIARASGNPLPMRSVRMADAVFPARQRVESRVLRRKAMVSEAPFWPTVPGVLEWLEVIWWHLLVNALEYGGEACRIDLGWCKQGEDSLRFEIRDNGPGVPESLRGKLFREYNRLHEDREVPGLGLSIVQRLVELQGGSCGYEQPAEGGACFFFILPSEVNPDATSSI